MATSKALQRAVRKYDSKTYEKVTFRVLKGQKAELDQAAKDAGMSLNKYITSKLGIDTKV